MKRMRGKAAAEAVIVVSPHLQRERYQAGFAHALAGGKLDRAEYFKLSFRAGFRAAHLHMRELRRRQGVIAFPLQGKVRVKAQ